MKNFNNLSGILSIFLVLFVGLGCGSSITTSHKDLCVTPDGSWIGAIGGHGKSVLIDAESGKIINGADDGSKSGAIVCSANNEVFSIYNEFAVWLTKDRRVERSFRWGRIIGITKDNNLVAYSGGRSSSSDDQRGESLKIYLTNIADTSEEVKKPMVIPLEKFEGIRKNASSYYILPVRLLNNDELLITAGAVPSSYQYGDNIETKVNPEPWGFFLLNLQNGNIRQHGSTKTNDPEINFIDSPRPFSTLDGSFLALVSGYDTGNVVAVYNAKTDKEIFRHSVSNEHEIADVILTEDGRQMAVAVKHYKISRNGRSTSYAIKIYDLTRKAEVKEFSIKNQTPYLIDFREDELIINHYSDTISKLNTQNGQAIWEIKFPEPK